MYNANMLLAGGNQGQINQQLFIPDAIDNMPVFATEGTVPMEAEKGYTIPTLAYPSPSGIPDYAGAGRYGGGAAGGAWTGTPEVPELNEPSDAQKALSGAATGASIGTAIMPGWGTAIGAIAGGLLSLF